MFKVARIFELIITLKMTWYFQVKLYKALIDNCSAVVVQEPHPLSRVWREQLGMALDMQVRIKLQQADGPGATSA
jgi:hypothetical protein